MFSRCILIKEVKMNLEKAYEAGKKAIRYAVMSGVLASALCSGPCSYLPLKGEETNLSKFEKNTQSQLEKTLKE